MPRLLARLEQMPDYSIFRGYIIVSFRTVFTMFSEQRKLSALFAFRASIRLSGVILIFFNVFHNSNTTWLAK